MKKILVTSATGKQGSAAAYELLKNDFEVFALTRNPQSSEAVNLKKAGATLVKGDLEGIEDLKEIFKKVDGLYLVLPPVWVSSKESDEKEAEIGIRTIKLAEEQGVKFVLYSSVLGSDKQHIFRPKFKFTIEKYLLKSDLQGAVIRPASFMENLLLPSFGLAEGKFINSLPEERAISWVTANDIGTFARIIFQNYKAFNGKTVDFGGKLFTPKQVLKLLQEKLDQSIEFEQVPLEVLYQQSETFAKLVEMIDKEGYDPIDYKFISSWMPKLTDFEQWIDEIGIKKIKELRSVDNQS
ncbi:NmrA family NAD(P)-binding protein [Pedobacter kyonggii]|uniref:NAD-dependent epimerase/dehydratase family protein n=1 Tax=Pedobacter kyonggii TaxID=1926871 RepID=A0A4Q9HGN5_9SPHI|nr:NmrA family NAD(P)-binding protein [Pedobacter kyonggii]TBO44416.1 NAD-dependent epimerase/dehydratase family protein [Pedobacter kyonggii]